MIQDKIFSYFERNKQLRVLFIFDQMDIIGSELRDCTWSPEYVFHTFDGAWFNTKYAIENDWKDKRVVLLFPDATYPLTEKEMLKFPLLDILKANMIYKGEDYAYFIQQYNLPAESEQFIKRNINEITSSKIMPILDGYLTAESFSEDIVCRALLSCYLGEKKLLDWQELIIRLLVLDNSNDTKKQVNAYNRINKNKDVITALHTKLKSLFGVSYNANKNRKFTAVAECLKYNLITQRLDTNSSDDYKSYKITNPIQLNQINKLYEIGINDSVYGQSFIEAISSLGVNIKESTIIECYGIDADYFYLTEPLCWPILKFHIEHGVVEDSNNVTKRMREFSSKFASTLDIQYTIHFIELVALYYGKVRNIRTLKLNTPEEYVKWYTDEFYVIDLYYRHSVEKYYETIKKSPPIEQSINSLKENLDRNYAQLTNELNLEWLKCINEQENYFDSLSLPKQENFYDECVESLDAKTKKVVIVCDALRYELAMELMQKLSREKHVATISAMRAMLPTETKFCKPALLPHKTLKLQDCNMLVDDSILSDKKQREKHLKNYREDALCMNYKDFMSSNISLLRKDFKHSLVYIFYDTIDEIAHRQNSVEVVNICHSAIEQLVALIKRLHATLNITNVFVTSDHGFIYNDKLTFEEKDIHSVKEEKSDMTARYYLTSSKEQIDNIVKYPLSKVSGMTETNMTYIAVPIGTNRFGIAGGYKFAHGGASLQEMVIPVIHSVLRRKDKTQKVGVTLLSNNLNMVSSQLKFKLIQTEATSMTTIERRISCCIYCGDEPVTIEKELLLNSNDSEDLNNREYEVTLNLNKSVNSDILQLRIVDVDDKLNPLIKETVKNSTIIEQDF